MAEFIASLDELVPVAKAQQAILAQVAPLPVETVALEDAYGRTTACDLSSDIDVSPFDNSAMDGFAFRATDVANASAENPARLQIVAHIAAGDWYDQEVQPGQCVRIMTGAALPDGADTVEMIEKVTFTEQGLIGDYLVMDHPLDLGKNVRYSGEEVKAGTVALPAGTIVGPAAMGLLASTGNTTVPVHRRPTVGILSLGSELVDATEYPARGHIRNSNGPALSGCVRRAGALPKVYPTLADDYDAIKATLAQAVAECDFVISSGGASAGDFDYITDIAGELGQVFFKYVNMRPGKSQTFAMLDGTPFLGLAGNPAAAICGFEMLVFPALQKMQGRKALFHPVQQASLGKDTKKKGTRENYLRATLTRDAAGSLVATPYKNQSSALFGTLHTSDCLVVVPGDVSFLPAGAEVTCVHLDIDAGTVI